MTNPTTQTNHQNDTLTPDLSTNGENPVENLKKAIEGTPGELSPAKALSLVVEALGALTEAMPEDARERLSRLGGTLKGYPDPKAAKDAEVASQRQTAAVHLNSARNHEHRAEALEALTPDEWLAHKTAKDLEQAKRSAERAEARDGSVSVDITTEVTETVRVTKEEMRVAGWHHNADCKKFDPDAVPDSDDRLQMVAEARALRADTHYALQDWHDRAHGLTSWANCPNEPCKLLPEAAKVFKIGGRS